MDGSSFVGGKNAVLFVCILSAVKSLYFPYSTRSVAGIQISDISCTSYWDFQFYMLVRMYENKCNRCVAILVSYCFILGVLVSESSKNYCALPLHPTSNQSDELISFTWHKNRRCFTQQRTVVICLTLPASIILARFRSECQ